MILLFTSMAAIRLRSIAEIVDRDAATKIDVLEGMSGFAIDDHQVFPHASERLGERLDVWCLGSNVNVNARDMDEFGILQGTSEGA